MMQMQRSQKALKGARTPTQVLSSASRRRLVSAPWPPGLLHPLSCSFPGLQSDSLLPLPPITPALSSQHFTSASGNSRVPLRPGLCLVPTHIQKKHHHTQLGRNAGWRGATDLALSSPARHSWRVWEPLPQYHEQALATATQAGG